MITAIFYRIIPIIMQNLFNIINKYQNLEFIRQLIRENREYPGEDMERLRMIQGTNAGTDNLTTKKGDE